MESHRIQRKVIFLALEAGGKVNTILSQYMSAVLFHDGRLTNRTYRGDVVYWKDNSFYAKWIHVL